MNAFLLAVILGGAPVRDWFVFPKKAAPVESKMVEPVSPPPEDQPVEPPISPEEKTVVPPAPEEHHADAEDRTSLIERMIMKAKIAQMAKQEASQLQQIPGMPPAEDKEMPPPSPSPPRQPVLPPVTNAARPVARNAQMAVAYSMTDSLDSAIRIYDDLPKAAQPHVKQKLVVYSPSWCPNCPGILNNLGENPLFDLSDVRDEAPESISLFPAIYDPVSGWSFSGNALNDWQTLIKRMNARRHQTNQPLMRKPMAIGVGTIKREYIDQALTFLGEQGQMRLGNDPFVYTQGMFSVKLPERVQIDWATKDGLTRFTFAPRMSVGVSGIRQSVSAITISQDKLTLKIDWLPDVSLNLE